MWKNQLVDTNRPVKEPEAVERSRGRSSVCVCFKLLTDSDIQITKEIVFNPRSVGDASPFCAILCLRAVMMKY